MKIHNKQPLVKIFYCLLFFLTFQSAAFSQVDIGVMLVAHKMKDIQDSIYFHSTDSTDQSAIFSDAYINSAIGFIDSKAKYIDPETINCNTPFFTNDYGYHMFFKSKIFEVSSEAKFLGNQVLSFDNEKTVQEIFDENATGTDTFRLTNIQLNNPKGVKMKNANMKVERNFNLSRGKFTMDNNAVEMLKDANFTCYSPVSYLITGGDAKVIKSNILKETTIPIGTASTIALAKINLNNTVPDFKNHRLSFNVDSFTNKSKTVRYDESADLQWKIKNLTNNINVKIDSLKVAVTKSYVDRRANASNFIGTSAFISQYTSEEKNVHGGDSSLSNWDAIPIGKFNPRLSYVLPYNIGNPMVMYKRSLNLDLEHDLLQENYFTLTNLNKTPLGSKIDGVIATPTADSCVVDLRWRPTDVYYADLLYAMYLTNDIAGDKSVLQELKPSNIELKKEELYTNFSLNSIAAKQDVFTTSKPMFIKMVQTDKYGTEITSDYTPLPVTCTTRLKDIDETKDPVVYAVRNGPENVTLYVEYMAEFVEDINFKLYNILGMEEADLGVRTMINKPNKLAFNLPGNITRNQRYILVLYGGILNVNLTRKALSIFIP